MILSVHDNISMTKGIAPTVSSNAAPDHRAIGREHLAKVVCGCGEGETIDDEGGLRGCGGHGRHCRYTTYVCQLCTWHFAKGISRTLTVVPSY